MVSIDGNGPIGVIRAEADSNGNNGELYTRNGNLSLNNEGFLVTSDGRYVLNNENERIFASGGSFVIDETGHMFLDDAEIGKLKLVNFEDLRYVEKEFSGIVRQGFLETSNVNTVQEMINMITLNRNYEANQKVIQAHDSIMEKSSNQIGKL